MNRNDYGTCWTNDAEDVREFSGPTADFAGKPDEQRGFRLAFDDTDRAVRGGSGYYSARNACVAYCIQVDPPSRRDFVGFRLVRDER